MGGNHYKIPRVISSIAILTENVPEAFSSNKGSDFRTVLEEIAEAKIPMPEGGKWATAGMVELSDRQVAWRVLDAQYWGVPQRRKRIFLVCDFGGKRAGEVLFKSESLLRNIEESKEERERTTTDTKRSSGKASRNITYSFSSFESNSMKSKNPHSGCREVDVARTIDTTIPDPAKNQGGIAILHKTNAIILNDQGGSSITVEKETISPTLRSESHGNQPIIAFSCNEREVVRGSSIHENVSFTLNSTDKHAVLASGKPVTGTLMASCSTKLWQGNQEAFGGDYSVIQNKQVRRLSPRECGRLQGFPDGWCADIPHSDTAEYKMWGNGMALPCVLYIMQNIVDVYR